MDGNIYFAVNDIERRMSQVEKNTALIMAALRQTGHLDKILDSDPEQGPVKVKPYHFKPTSKKY